MKIRTYSELIALPTFEERYKYLRLSGYVGEATFGFDRFFNQQFYHSSEWRNLRHKIIVRDNCCDLAHPDHELRDRVYIHHMNPISIDDIKDSTDLLFNPEFLITVSMQTHNAIHYGTESTLPKGPIERAPGDQCPWKH